MGGEAMKPNTLLNRLSITIWRIGYALEEARQDHVAAGRLWQQAGCCIALSFFRLIGGRGL